MVHIKTDPVYNNVVAVHNKTDPVQCSVMVACGADAYAVPVSLTGTAQASASQASAMVQSSAMVVC